MNQECYNKLIISIFNGYLQKPENKTRSNQKTVEEGLKAYQAWYKENEENISFTKLIEYFKKTIPNYQGTLLRLSGASFLTNGGSIFLNEHLLPLIAILECSLLLENENAQQQAASAQSNLRIQKILTDREASFKKMLAVFEWSSSHHRAHAEIINDLLGSDPLQTKAPDATELNLDALFCQVEELNNTLEAKKSELHEILETTALLKAEKEALAKKDHEQQLKNQALQSQLAAAQQEILELQTKLKEKTDWISPIVAEKKEEQLKALQNEIENNKQLFIVQAGNHQDIAMRLSAAERRIEQLQYATRGEHVIDMPSRILSTQYDTQMLRRRGTFPVQTPVAGLTTSSTTEYPNIRSGFL